MRFVTPAQMREMDRRMIESIGLPGMVLMERAALGACDVLELQFEHVLRIAVICGGGNNGGDGLAMARILAERGYVAEVFLLSAPSKYQGDAKANLDVAKAIGLTVHNLSEASADQIETDLLRHGSFDTWVDAIFGTGLDREVGGIHRAAIEFLSGQDQVISVDIPSGVNGLSGQIMGVAVRAHATATFAYPKQGIVLSPGRAFCGQLYTVGIGICAQVSAAVGTAGELLTSGPLLAARPTAYHKGDAGRVVAIGGLAGKTGAILMTSRAAMRCGAGLLIVGTDTASAPMIAPALNEVMAAPIFDRTGLDRSALLEHLAWSDVVAIGPGLGTDAFARLAVELVVESQKASVFDADGLNVLPQTQLSSRTILTPHPGEMARLRQCSVAEVLDDPLGHAQALAAAHGAVVVLKGPATIVVSPDGRIAVNTTGNSGMATAGMGDALTGIAAVMLLEIEDPFEAACAAVWIHGLAGDIAAEPLGERSLLVSDLIRAIPEVLRDLEASAVSSSATR